MAALLVNKDGTASLHEGGTEEDMIYDAVRELTPDDVVDGKAVRDYAPGVYEVEDAP